MSSKDLYQNEQKNDFRERLIVTDLLRKDPEFISRERKGVLQKIRILCTVIALLLVAFCAGLFFYYNAEFTTYSVEDEQYFSGMQNGQMFSFQGGNILLGTDSVTFLKENTFLWTLPTDFTDPMYEQEGNYFVLYDRGSYEFYLYDATGLLSSTQVSREIMDLSISQNGVTAVLTGSEEASFISYFDRYGSKIDVEVKTVLSSTGYPVDLAISPNGQELLVTYYSVKSGVGESALYFYDFENGNASEDYLVASFQDFQEQDVFIGTCDFFTDSQAVAVGDSQLIFLEYNQKTGVSENRILFPEGTVSYLKETNYLGLIREENGGALLTQYDFSGQIQQEFSVPSDYQTILSDKNFIYFFNGKKVSVYNATGRLRYEGTLPKTPVSVSTVSGATILVNDGSKITKMTFK